MNWKDDIKKSIDKIRDKIDDISSRTIRTDVKVCNFVDKEFPMHQKVGEEYQKKNDEWHNRAEKKLNECPRDEKITAHEGRLTEVEKMANKASVWIWIFAALLISGFGAIITFLLKILFKNAS